MALNGRPPGIVITHVFNCIEICILFFVSPGLMTQYHLSLSLSNTSSLFLITPGAILALTIGVYEGLPT